MQTIARMSPATYALKGMRLAILEGRGVLELTDYYTPLLLIGSILLPFGIWMFQVMEKYAKKKGLLKRSG